MNDRIFMVFRNCSGEIPNPEERSPKKCQYGEDKLSHCSISLIFIKMQESSIFFLINLNLEKRIFIRVTFKILNFEFQ